MTLANAIAALQTGNQTLATTLLRKTLAQTPDDSDALNLLGMNALDDGTLTLPAALSRSLALVPNDPAFLRNLGLAALRRERLDVAAAGLEGSLALVPDFAESHLDLGNLAARYGDYARARTHYDRAVALAPEHVGAHQNRGWATLALGDFRRGFRDYAWRWRQPIFAALKSGLRGQPWDGRPVDGTLLLIAEQGFGDTLQFCRLAPAVAPLAKRVMLEVQGELATLLQRSFPDIEVVARHEDFPAPAHRPPHDRYAALLDLPVLLDLDVGRIPNAVPYLKAEPNKVAAWTNRLASLPGRRRIGLVWAGNARADDPAAAEVDRRRSLPLAAFAPLGAVTDASFVSLQIGAAADALVVTPLGFPVADVASGLRDFDDTAALVAGLDLVVTVDTAVAHLAGALGRPVWVLSRADHCWRWLAGHDDSPWYPTMRLFRQRRPGEWAPVVAEVVRALSLPAGARRRP